MRMHKKTLGTTVLFVCFALEELCIKYRHEPPPSRPQATEGSPEGRVPLALSAQDRPPRRRTKQQLPHSRVQHRLPALSLRHVMKVNCNPFNQIGYFLICFALFQGRY